MKGRLLLVIAVGLLGLLAVSVGTAAATDHLPEEGVDIDVDPQKKYANDSGSLYAPGTTTATPSVNNVTVVFELSGGAPERVDELEGLGATVQSRYQGQAQVEVQAENLPMYRNLSWVEEVRRPYESFPTVVSEGVGVINADDVHKNGITGQNVTVGVLDNEGFDPSNSEISSNVVDHRSFKSNGGIESGSEHGTSVSEIVVDTAPDSELYLANFRTGVEYANAADWIRNQDVDVIVMSVGFFNQPYDGDGFVSEVADDAVNNDGIVWVNAAGNSANSHWEGGFSNPDGNQFLNFGPNDESNFLNEGGAMSAGQPVQVTLSWDDWPQSDQDYDLLLVRNSDDTVVGISEGLQTGSQEPTEIIRTRLPSDGKYYVAVRVFGASAPQNLEMFFLGAGKPEHNVARSSVVAPATGNEVTSVGAFFHRDGSLEEFSSRGPTNDGRTGVDVVAPDRVSTTGLGRFSGTSAAAPHAGGAAALVLSEDPSLSPAEVEQRLESTAVDVRAPGEDTESGHGKLDALSAVRKGATADFEVSIDNTNSPVTEGDSLRINATVTNTGNRQGTQTVIAQAPGLGSNTSTISLGVGSSTTEEFRIPTSTGEAGNYTVTVRSANSSDSTGVTVERGGTNGVGSVSVSATGDTASPGGTATVGVNAQSVGSVTVNTIPSSWNVSSSQNDGAFVAPDGNGDNVREGGNLAWAWASNQPSVDVSVTLDIPTGTPKQEFVLGVEAENSTGATDNDTAKVAVGDCPFEPVVCSFDSGGNIDTGDLQNAINDFIQGGISTGELQAVINAFISSQ